MAVTISRWSSGTLATVYPPGSALLSLELEETLDVDTIHEFHLVIRGTASLAEPMLRSAEPICSWRDPYLSIGEKGQPGA